MVIAVSPGGAAAPVAGELADWQAVIGIALGEPVFGPEPGVEKQTEPRSAASGSPDIREVIAAQERERRRLARELHDTVGQALMAVRLDLESLRHEPRRLMERRRLSASLEIVDQAMASIRDFALELRPPILDDLGLIAATRWYVRRQAALADFHATVVSNAEAGGFSIEIETACFRVLQEAIMNVVRHSEATTVGVELAGMGDALVLTVVDDGIGFEIGAGRVESGTGTWLGLHGMRERARILGGSLEVISELGRGVRIVATFPRPEALGAFSVA